MDKFKHFSFLLLFMSLTFCLFIIIRQTEDECDGYVYPKIPAFTPKIEARLSTEEDRRCEGKLHTSPVSLNLKLRQYARKKLLQDMCSINKWRTLDQIPQEDLYNLLVDDRHGIVYCYIPKVACTAWRRIMIVLSESLKVYGVPYRNPADIPIEHVHGPSLQHLNAYPKEVLRQKLETYKKFMFVRDPFVRLISAYKDKLQSKNQMYYTLIGTEILRKFGNVSSPPASVQKAYAAGIVPSFYHFIQYILSLPAGNNKGFDEHWRQAIHLCHPCLIDYDFIGKMETIEEDAAQLLRMLNVDNLVSFKPWSRNKTEPNEIKAWFADIPAEWRRKLYEMYEADFSLFGYEEHEDLDDFGPENIT